jgi:hypothetical protein
MNVSTVQRKINAKKWRSATKPLKKKNNNNLLDLEYTSESVATVLVQT